VLILERKKTNFLFILESYNVIPVALAASSSITATTSLDIELDPMSSQK
jgi:hypothetical protein